MADDDTTDARKWIEESAAPAAAAVVSIAATAAHLDPMTAIALALAADRGTAALLPSGKRRVAAFATQRVG